MYKISNTDFERALRLLRSFAATKGGTLREQEERRKAKLLIRKLERKTQNQL